SGGVRHGHAAGAGDLSLCERLPAPGDAGVRRRGLPPGGRGAGPARRGVREGAPGEGLLPVARLHTHRALRPLLGSVSHFFTASSMPLTKSLSRPPAALRPAPTPQPMPAAQLLASAMQVSKREAASLLVLWRSVIPRTQRSIPALCPHSVANR